MLKQTVNFYHYDKFNLNLSFKVQTLEVDEDEDFCAPAHEQYIGTNPSDLGKFGNAAVAVDSILCSTIGK
jgi:hypothetical protein